jgi:hypothetical protein
MSVWLKKFPIAIAAAILPVFAIPSNAASNPVYQWHTFFGGDAGDGANLPATTVDASGNLYVTGWTQYPWDEYGNPTSSVPLNYFEAYLTKISPVGVLLWSKFYTGYGQSSSGLQATAITLDSAGNVYIAGNGNVVNDGNYGCFVMETDSAGNVIGGANIGRSNYGSTCSVYGIAYDAIQNYVYVTGLAAVGWRGGQPVNSLPTNGGDAMFILQAQGVEGGVGLGWVGFYYNPPGGGNTYGRAIAVDGSSNLYVAGCDGDNGAVWKVSSTGAQAWEFIYGSFGTYAYALALYGGNVYVAGYSATGWNGPKNQLPLNAFASGGVCCAVAFVLKLDTGGNYTWHTFYHGNYHATVGEGIAVDGPSAVYVTGQGDLVGYDNAPPLHDDGGNGHYILQLNDAGAYQWHSLYGGTRWDEASSIAVDSLHNVFVSGWTGYISWNADNNTPPLHAGSLAASEVFVMKFSRAAKIGTYNAGQWRLDTNGNGAFEGAPLDVFGWAGATYVTGDWNGDGRTKIGVYYQGFWYLDYDGNGVWDGGVNDKQYVFGWADPNVIPVVGDWNGDGRAKIGVYCNGFWYLDYNGNGIWDGASTDKQYTFGWVASGLVPIVGDWSGSGTAKIGIYYNGIWYLDYNGNGTWDGSGTDKAYTFGWAASGVTPILGDWSGDGRAKIGIYYNGYWYLDYDGNGVWDGGVNDKAYNFGWSGVTPLIGDWSGSGTAKIGVFYSGYWYLDYIGNGIWDGGVIDKGYVWGQSGDTPIVGRW